MKASPIPTFIKYDPRLISARGEGKLWFREGSDMKGRAARPARGWLSRALRPQHPDVHSLQHNRGATFTLQGSRVCWRFCLGCKLPFCLASPSQITDRALALPLQSFWERGSVVGCPISGLSPAVPVPCSPQHRDPTDTLQMSHHGLCHTTHSAPRERTCPSCPQGTERGFGVEMTPLPPVCPLLQA